jgi:hypothetical protein
MSDDKKNDGDRDEPRQDQPALSDETIQEAWDLLNHGVGYKRPPRHTRFKKGQSGNPKGRPRKNDFGLGAGRSANRLALQEADRRITLTDASGPSEITAIEAVIRKQLATALKGNAYAQKHAIERYDVAERERRSQIAEDIEIWEYYIEQTRKEIADAEAKGETPPNPLPHPDDIVLDHDKGVRFLGPILPEDVDRLEKTCKLRDLLILQHELDCRLAGDRTKEDPLDGPASLLFVHAFNRWVPPRLRLSEGDIVRAMLHANFMTKRQLLKSVYRGWRELGERVPRGTTFVSLRHGKMRLEFVCEIAQRMSDGRLDVENSTTAEIAEELTDLYEELGGRVDR